MATHNQGLQMKQIDFKCRLYNRFNSISANYIFENIKKDYKKEAKEGGFRGTFEEYLEEYATREEL